MQYFYKFTWFLRAIFYKLIFRNFGNFSYFGSPLFIMNARRISIGSRVRIFPGLRAECHGSGRLFIHENISIGQGLHIIASSDLHVRSGCLISANVFITDTDHSYEDINKPVFGQMDKVEKTVIGENCFLGIGVRIQAGTVLGKGCIVGANSVVRGVFPDHSVIVGVPARVIKKYNVDTEVWERC